MSSLKLSLYSTVDVDFVILDEAVTFVAESPPGTSLCFTVSIVADDVRENDETIDLLLLSDDIIVDETSIFTITIEEGEYLYSPLHVQSQDHSHSIYMYTSVLYADVILGFQEPMYTVTEGQSVDACVEIFSGVADGPLRLQMVSLLAGDAEGWIPHYAYLVHGTGPLYWAKNQL